MVKVPILKNDQKSCPIDAITTKYNHNEFPDALFYPLKFNHSADAHRGYFTCFGKIRPDSAQRPAVFDKSMLGQSLRHQSAFHALAAEQQRKFGDVTGADYTFVFAPEVGIEINFPTTIRVK